MCPNGCFDYKGKKVIDIPIELTMLMFLCRRLIPQWLIVGILHSQLATQ